MFNKVKEIGSEFWDVPTQSEINLSFPDNIQWFLAGRSALKAIIKDISSMGCCSVAMPSWCCESIVKPFIEAGINVHFYPVYWENGLNQEIYQNYDALMLIDYFGYTATSPDLTSYKGIVIRDVTHSIFSTLYSDANYYFGSLRKWCGMWTGGYAWTKNGLSLKYAESDDHGFTAQRKMAMQLKESFILGHDNNGETDENKIDFLRAYKTAESLLEQTDICVAAERDISLAKQLNVEFIKSRHRSNAEVLRKAFYEWLMFPEMLDTDCPMFVPILVPNGKRDELRQYLIKNGIYCPIHWPMNEYHKTVDKTAYLYSNELSLVCDQRYSENDMKRVVETVISFFKER